MFTFVKRLKKREEDHGPADFLDLIERVLLADEVGATAFRVHEVLGTYDLLLEVWIPEECIAGDVDALLHDALVGLDPFVRTNYFEARHTVCDVRWHQPATSSLPGKYRRPGAFTPTELRYLDVLNEVSWRSAVSLGEDGSLKVAKGTEVPADLGDAIAWADGLNLAHLTRDAEWLRLFFIITWPLETLPLNNHAFDKATRDSIEGAIRSVIQGFDPESMGEAKFYSGSGVGVYFGVVALRVGSYFRHIAQILNELNLALDGATAKLYTIVAASASPALWSDRFEVSPEVGEVDQGGASLADLGLLGLSEGSELEYKSSTKLDVKRLLHSGRIEASEDVTLTILKTVTSFLNHNGGGRLVVGLTEVDRLVTGSLAVEEVRSRLLSEGWTPVVDASELLIAPMGRDVALWNVDAKDWDGFRTRLHRVFQRIAPEPVGLVRIERRIVSQGMSVEGDAEEVWVVDVHVTGHANLNDHRWYYLDDEQFWVRDGSNTKRLHGANADDYKRRSSSAGATAQPGSVS